MIQDARSHEIKIWSPMYREDHRLRTSKNGVLREMFGPDREGRN
jgi:hypothetical protein